MTLDELEREYLIKVLDGYELAEEESQPDPRHQRVHAVRKIQRYGLERELYTYEGSGTLFTLEDYCRVERVGIDDFREVESLLERGQREGFLKIRSRQEIGQILFTGFGATIGSCDLAGVGSLLCEPFLEDNVGEIVALYTINRFAGEGVGAKLLARLLEEARARGLASVFACTGRNGAPRSSSRATGSTKSVRTTCRRQSGRATTPSGGTGC